MTIVVHLKQKERVRVDTGINVVVNKRVATEERLETQIDGGSISNDVSIPEYKAQYRLPRVDKLPEQLWSKNIDATNFKTWPIKDRSVTIQDRRGQLLTPDPYNDKASNDFDFKLQYHDLDEWSKE